jgi:hypothetical protein
MTELRKRRKESHVDAEEFDRLTRVHTTGASRRGIVAGLGRGLFAALSLALVGSASVADADAKRKKRHRKHKKHKKHKKTPTALTGPGYCALGGQAELWVTTGRVAQTFLPPTGGQLTQAAVFLQSNPANFSLVFDIRPVDAAGVPTNTVLASHTVSNIPQTLLAAPPRLITANFGTPATLTLGQQYALSVTGPGIDQYWIHISGDDCPDGQLFHDLAANGSFVAIAGGAADLSYAVSVV